MQSFHRLPYEAMLICAGPHKTQVHSLRAKYLGEIYKDFLSYANVHLGKIVTREDLETAFLTGDFIKGTNWRARVDFEGLWYTTQSWQFPDTGRQWSETQVFASFIEAEEFAKEIMDGEGYEKTYEGLCETFYYCLGANILFKMGHVHL